MRQYYLAKIAYNAYCKSTGGVSLISGDKLPEFEVLRQEIKDAWYDASNSVREYVVSDLLT